MNAVGRRFAIACLLFLALPLTVGTLGCSRGGSAARSTAVERRGQILFVSDFAAGKRLAAEKGMPCLLFFTAEWCTFCHQMEETAFRDPQVSGLSENFVCVLVDADHYPQVCQQYSVTGYPTIQFVSSSGSILHRLVGRQTAPNLAHGMRAALKRYAWLRDAGTSIR